MSHHLNLNTNDVRQGEMRPMAKKISTGSLLLTIAFLFGAAVIAVAAF